MAQRHPHDDTIRLPARTRRPRSPLFVPIPLTGGVRRHRRRHRARPQTQIVDDEVKGPMVRNVAGRPVVVDPKSSDDDFAVALTWLKLDEAARRLSRDNERRTSHEQNQRIHTCKFCGRYDKTANTGNGVTADQWCQLCRDEKARQEIAEHAAHKVNGKPASPTSSPPPASRSRREPPRLRLQRPRVQRRVPGCAVERPLPASPNVARPRAEDPAHRTPPDCPDSHPVTSPTGRPRLRMRRALPPTARRRTRRQARSSCPAPSPRRRTRVPILLLHDYDRHIGWARLEHRADGLYFSGQLRRGMAGAIGNWRGVSLGFCAASA